LKLGHREIGLYMPGPEPRVSHPRRVGFERALAEFGVTVHREWFFCGGNYEEGGSNLARQFLGLRRRPTAMCVVNDDAAVAFIAEIGRAGIGVPEDLSVVSHDDLPIARFFPVTLTTVSNPVEAVSKGVHSLLMRRLQSPDASIRSITVRGELMIRQSAAAPFKNSS
jgi:DNA-binding LacI/PurR family transcriptional regulator